MEQGREYILQFYISIIDFLADFLGPDFEIVLHDVVSVEKSIIYIRNNFSGRKIGGSITDLGLRVLKEHENLKDSYYVNYSSKTAGGRILRSATYFISDSKGKLVAMLCINMDVTKPKYILDYLDSVIRGEIKTEAQVEKEPSGTVTEILVDSVEDLAYQMISDVISCYSVPVARMTLNEKKEIVFELDKKGFFLIKGTVKMVSKRLDLSETTVYRCLSSS